MRAMRLTLLLLAALALWLPRAGLAEVRRLEAVGATPVDPSRRGGLGLRDQAIQAALREAVVRVARELLLEAESPEDEGESLSGILGTDMVRYTSRFQILEDQGERPALFSEDPEVATEYVVIVEVYVDVDRVQSRLVDAGLIAGAQTSEERSRLLIEVYGLTRYPAYQALRALLTEAAADPALPLSLEHGRSVFAVDVDDSLGRDGFLDRLRRLAPEGLGIRPLAQSEGRLSLEATWSPPEEENDLRDGWDGEDLGGNRRNARGGG